MAQKIPAKTIRTCQRRARALQMRLDGHTYQEIGEDIGISTMAAYKHVIKALENLNKDNEEKAEWLISMECARLDRLHWANWEAAISGGDLPAVDRILKIMERRSKLLGLDAPNKIAQTNIDGTEDRFDQMSDEELEARIKELDEKHFSEMSDADLLEYGLTRLPAL